MALILTKDKLYNAFVMDYFPRGDTLLLSLGNLRHKQTLTKLSKDRFAET